MGVIPAPAIAAIFSAVQIPPPTAIRSVTHVISIRIRLRLTRTFLFSAFLFRERLLRKGLSRKIEPRTIASAQTAGNAFLLSDSTRGEIDNAPGFPSRLRFILRHPLSFCSDPLPALTF